MKFCSNCGSELEEDMKFCSNCGEPIKKMDEVAIKDDAIGSNIEDDLEEDRLIAEMDDGEEDDSEEAIDSGDTISGDYSDLEVVEDEAEEDLDGIEGIEAEEYYDGDDVLYADMDDDLAATQIMDPIDDEMLDDYDGEEGYEYEEEEGFGEKLKGMKLPLIIGGIALILLIGFLLFRGGSRPGNKDELIEEFITGISNRDESKVERILEPGAPDLKINREGVKALFKYLDENPSYVSDIQSSLEGQSKEYDDLKDKKVGLEEVPGNFLLKTDDGKDYQIEVKPYYMELSLKEEGATIYLNDDKLEKTNRENFTKEFGPYMPGIYSLRVSYDADFTETELEQDIELVEESPRDDKVIMSFDIELELVEIGLTSSYKDGRIYINGEDSGQKISDLKGGKLGPIHAETKVYIVADTPWGEFKSREIIVGEAGSNVELEIALTDDKIKEEIRNAVDKFLKEDGEAKKTLDGGKYSNLMDPELSSRKSRIKDIESKGYYIETTISGTSYGMDSIVVVKNNDEYHGNITVAYNVKEVYLWSQTRDEQEGKINLDIELSYDESKNQWIIYNIHEDSSLTPVGAGPVEEEEEIDENVTDHLL